MIMKSTGFVKKIDKLSRVGFPFKLRKNFNLELRDSIEMFVDDTYILLKKYDANRLLGAKKRDNNSAVIVRKIEPLGRICLPYEFRERLNLEAGDSIEIFVDETYIYFKKYVTTNILFAEKEEYSTIKPFKQL